MSSLSTKSDREISKLLDQYGIKHGPVIGELVQMVTLTLTTNMAPNGCRGQLVASRANKANNYDFVFMLTVS